MNLESQSVVQITCIRCKSPFSVYSMYRLRELFCPNCREQISTQRRQLQAFNDVWFHVRETIRAMDALRREYPEAHELVKEPLASLAPAYPALNSIRDQLFEQARYIDRLISIAHGETP